MYSHWGKFIFDKKGVIFPRCMFIACMLIALVTAYVIVKCAQLGECWLETKTCYPIWNGFSVTGVNGYGWSVYSKTSVNIWCAKRLIEISMAILCFSWLLSCSYKSRPPEKLSTFIVSTVPVDGLTLSGARPSAGIVMIKFGSSIHKGLLL